MAEFEVNVVKIDDVIDHPNADRLTIVTIGGYKCIANKHEDGTWRYQAGDLVVYIPEQSVVPEWLLKHMNFWNDEKGKGGLSGSRGNRVKAMKLRGTFSQGILLAVEPSVFGNCVFVVHPPHEGNQGCGSYAIGDNVAEDLGIFKYEPPIPASMRGEVWAAGQDKCLKFDIQNIQKYPDIFQEGEEVSVTEKLHGTWCCYGFWQREDTTGIKIVASKGLSAKGLAFKINEKNINSNLYLQTLERTRDKDGFDVLERLINYVHDIGITVPVYILGEVFGTGVQDLNYGEPKPAFRLFDVYIGYPTQGHYLDDYQKKMLAANIHADMVPNLYEGPFSMKKMEELRDGQDFSGSNIREGIVIVPTRERHDCDIGRVQLKFVSPDYLTRKNGTESN